ncbi:hypothetical protein DFH06DRAFT_1274964 [Mycena polygramma]|nr:hypothetical protein DFH06DRAFT_1274964 [Mycena polygramma]
MLDEQLSHTDRITQVQDSIQQLLTIMGSTLAYLTSRADFMQVSTAVPITKQRHPEKVDASDVFDGNKKELVTDLIVKAKQVEYLIESMPIPEGEEAQAARRETLDTEMTCTNAEYLAAVARSKDLHGQITDVLRLALHETDRDLR